MAGRMFPQPDLQAGEQGRHHSPDEYGIRCAHAVHRAEGGSTFPAGRSGRRLCAVWRGALSFKTDGQGGEWADEAG